MTDTYTKQLTKSDAQRKEKGNQRGSIVLNRAGNPIDHTTYFRDVFFGDCTWTPGVTTTGRTREDTTVTCRTNFLGNDLGPLDIHVSHEPNRVSAQGNYSSLLHIGPLQEYFTEHDVTQKELILYREYNEFGLSIIADTIIDDCFTHRLTSVPRTVAQRIGQERFKRDLIKLRGAICVFSDIENPNILRASHIKPWSDCAQGEHRNPFNGFLLAANIDAAFDAGLFTIGTDGAVIFSPRLSQTDRERLGFVRQTVRLRPENQPFLRWHRDKIFKNA